jgi:phosphohistidine phosphatase
MKRLILFRHAKSSWKHDHLRDFERPLNSRGKRDAPMMGKRLAEMHLKPDLIVASPAKRALKTATLVAGQLDYDSAAIVKEPDIYDAGPDDLYSVTAELKNKFTSVMLIGHNPGLTDFANGLCGAVIDNIPTCGVVCIDFLCDSWREVKPRYGTLVFFDYPKNSSGPVKPV